MNEVIVQDIWNRIFTLCENNGVKISHLSEEAGFTRSYISVSKARNMDVSLRLLEHVARKFNVSYDYLLTGKMGVDLRAFPPSIQSIISCLKKMPSDELVALELLLSRHCPE